MSLEISNLTISFGDKQVVRDVSLRVGDGDRLTIIGESGSGKTMTLLAILGLLPPAATVTGEIRYDGVDLLSLSESELTEIRGKEISCVFQEPATALNPTQRIGTSLTMALRRHQGLSKKDAKQRAVELAASVGLPQPDLIVRRYPHELSGGQRQRVVIAMAMSCRPSILLADEPTTALDATVQSKILELMDEQLGAASALVLVTHDMAVAYSATSRLVVMKDGQIVEEGQTDEVIRSPRTQAAARLVEAARATGLSR